MQTELVARFLSDKYDDIFVVARKSGDAKTMQQQFAQLPQTEKHCGWVIDLEDEEGVIDTATVDAKTIEQFFGVETKSEDELWEESQKRFTDSLIAMGLDPDEEHAKIVAQMESR